MSTTKSRKGRGRPKGSKTDPGPITEVPKSRCIKCQSTEREEYTNPKTLEHCGIAPDGKPYNFVSWKHTKCLKCGQRRVDKFFEYIV